MPLNVCLWFELAVLPATIALRVSRTCKYDTILKKLPADLQETCYGSQLVTQLPSTVVGQYPVQTLPN